MFEQYWFWLILGALLIFSEFFLTGIVAIFFGVGALLVGVATALGLLDTLAQQVLVFAALSVGTLLFARERVKVWFRGRVSERWDGDRDLIASRGDRVVVSRAIENGVGQVLLNGVEWKAESDDDHDQGATVWVIGHRGITLQVSGQRPTLEAPAADS